MARRAGTLELPRAAAAPAPNFRSVVAFLDQESPQRARTLRLDVRALVRGRDLLDQRSLAWAAGSCGVWWSEKTTVDGPVDAPWHGGAALRLVYGSSPGVMREVFADLRSGEYSIPPCQAVEVSVAFWAPDDPAAPQTLSTTSLEVSAEIADGDPVDCSPLTLTAWRTLETGYPQDCATPPGAWAFDLLPGSLEHMAATCGGQKVIRRAGGVWTPPTHPVIIAGHNCRRVTVWTDDQIGGPSWLAGIVFYVR